MQTLILQSRQYKLAFELTSISTRQKDVADLIGIVQAKQRIQVGFLKQKCRQGRQVAQVETCFTQWRYRQDNQLLLSRRIVIQGATGYRRDQALARRRLAVGQCKTIIVATRYLLLPGQQIIQARRRRTHIAMIGHVRNHQLQCIEISRCIQFGQNHFRGYDILPDLVNAIHAINKGSLMTANDRM